jgi:hypothetical protein
VAMKIIDKPALSRTLVEPPQKIYQLAVRQVVRKKRADDDIDRLLRFCNAVVGRFRGGLAVERAWRPLVPEVSLLIRSDRAVTPPSAIHRV